jgi:two-component system sensor histidine kinase NblS
MREALERLSRLSADLVEASRGELPRLDFSDLDLGEVVGKACQWATDVAAGREITLTYWCCPGAAAHRVRGNQDALLTVFGNLLSNAIRYTRPGGKVSVCVEFDPERGESVVCVRDTGIGMSPEVQARVFEKFFVLPRRRHLKPRVWVSDWHWLVNWSKRTMAVSP